MVDGLLCANDEERAATRRMQELRGQQLTYQQIADTLTAEGFATKRGGRWHPGTVRNILERAGTS